MSWLFNVAAGVGVVVALVALSPHVSHAQAVSDGASARAFVDQYCVACHSDRGYQRGAAPMSLQGLDMGELGAHADCSGNGRCGRFGAG